MIKTLHLQDFTAFADLQLQLGQGVNVLVGENGTGKTLLLKAAYAMGCAASAQPEAPRLGSAVAQNNLAERHIDETMARVFSPPNGDLRQLRRIGAAGDADARAVAEFTNGVALDIGISPRVREIVVGWPSGQYTTSPIPRPVFIPSKEVLTLARLVGENGAVEEKAVLRAVFDDTHFTLAAQMRGDADLSNGDGGALDPRYVNMLRNLVNLIKGDFRWRDGDFYLHAGRWTDNGADENAAEDAFKYNDFRHSRFVEDGEVCTSALSAEGYRKIGMLQRLIASGVLSPAGGVLLWDEPEANLNPKLARMVAKVLLELADTGYQIILATHENALLKWFDLLAHYHECDLRFHALYRGVNRALMVEEPVGRYDHINRNAIDEAWHQITGEQIEQETEEVFA